jgi:hypothetical protein
MLGSTKIDHGISSDDDCNPHHSHTSVWESGRPHDFVVVVSIVVVDRILSQNDQNAMIYELQQLLSKTIETFAPWFLRRKTHS